MYVTEHGVCNVVEYGIGTLADKNTKLLIALTNLVAGARLRRPILYAHNKSLCVGLANRYVI